MQNLKLRKTFSFLYEKWMALAEIMGTLVLGALLTVFFFAVITPTGLLMRLFSGDPLSRQWDPQASSYWIPVDHE